METPHNPSRASTNADTTAPGNRKRKISIFDCPSCGGIIRIRAVGHTVNAVCQHCAVLVDVANEKLSFISQAREKTRATDIEIGARGKLQGILWEVIGYLEKHDAVSYYIWDEYLLYNPYHGFRFLTQAGGHWNFYQVLKRDILGVDAKNEIQLDNEPYRIFHSGTGVVRYVKGEFYWRVKKGERARIADYIAPPYVLSSEITEDETILSHGLYLPPDEVKQAFQITAPLPYAIGVAPNQPAPFQGRINGILWVAIIGVVLATMIQTVTSMSAENADVIKINAKLYPESIVAAASTGAAGCDVADDWQINCDKSQHNGKNQAYLSPNFTLPTKSNVHIETTSPVRNDWAELQLSMIDQHTNTAYRLSHAIEYYEGRDADGYWSEGQYQADGYIQAAAAGTYRILVEADSSVFQKAQPIEVSMRVKRDVPAWGNYWITLLLLLVYPAYAMLRHYHFEHRRWADSDFAPSIYRLTEESDE